MNILRIPLAALAVATSLSALPRIADAQPVNGTYIGVGAGLNWKDNQTFGLTNFNGDTFKGGERASAKYNNPEFGLVGSIGYGLGNGIRLEIEGNWRTNSIASGQGARNSDITFGLGGHSDVYGVMANAFYDFHGLAPWIVPYIGGGIGYGWQHLSIHADERGCDVCGSASASGTLGGFAWQGILGASFPLPQVAPGLSLTLEGRAMGLSNSGNINISHVTFSGDTLNANRWGVHVNNDPNYSLLFGVRYAFNQAPPRVQPAAAAAPMVPPARSFMVFFDWDKYNLTERARGVIRDAAAASKSAQHTTVEVNGYADTSGSPGYNMPLSMKRAQTVAAELVRDGVAKNEIAIKAFGDTVLLVPTGAGVREPQNRRVEIIIR